MTCEHLPARSDVSMTLCSTCGVALILDIPDPELGVWRPLTDTERLVKNETIRQLRDLFHSVAPSEFARILFERLERDDTPSIRLAEGILGRWIIVNGQSEDLAWSGSRWVPHRGGFPVGDAQVCNFATREEAATFADATFPTIMS